MKHDFSAQAQKDQEEVGSKFSGNSKYFDLKEGNDNVMRILTPGAAFATFFVAKGQPYAVAYGEEKGDPRKEVEGGMTKSVRYVLYLIDRKDGLVKQAELPYTVIRSIGELQKNPDYTFDDLPMPYDIRVTYDKSEIPANKYKVAAIPKQVPVTPDELAQLEKLMAQETPEQAVENKKQKQIELDQEAGVWVKPSGVVKDEHAQSHPVDLDKSMEELGINPDDIPF